jgi:uncharacterized membrane protein YgdD (TMEM256/DUF423 family)
VRSKHNRGMNRNGTFVGAVLGALAVVAGAFGAHSIKDRVSAEALGWWQTAAQYHLVHAIALVLVGLLASRDAACAKPWCLRLSGWAFTLGIVLFSGSLYALALTNARWLGAVTPFGGALLIVGWCAFASAAWRLRPAREGRSR